jgi:6-pyruvoyltetrahydropterin/6-carboxytetrahydropterin synthase
MKAELSKTFEFDAGHHLLHVPEGHKCARPHGHRYRLTVIVEGEVDPRVGWVMDFGKIKEVVGPLVAMLDHNDLNDVEGLANTTSEMIAKWFWDRIKPAVPQLKAVVLSESQSSSCTYRGD